MASLGIIGLGTMGKSLAMNVASKKSIPVHVYNRDYKVTKRVIKEAQNEGFGEYIKGYEHVLDAVLNSDTTMLMLPHGDVFDNVVDSFLADVPNGYTFIDGANEHYKVSQKRGKRLDDLGYNYLGVGVSGGQEGARKGPCMMIGGSYESYENYDYIFSLIAGNANYGYYGHDYGVGHFVKTVHNGVEYAIMQAICEIYHAFGEDVLKEALNITNVSGNLIDITHKALTYDLNNISDVAKMNDTGMWCVQYAHEHKICIPMITAAVNARLMSNFDRAHKEKQRFTKVPANAVTIAAQSIAFAFGFAIYEGHQLVKSYTNLDYNHVMENWKKGAIISCNVLGNEYLDNVVENADYVRYLVSYCTINSVPIHSLNAALNFYNSLTSHKLSTSLLMAQRNVFGNHPIESIK